MLSLWDLSFFSNERLRFLELLSLFFLFSFLRTSQIILVFYPTAWPFLVLWEEGFGSYVFGSAIQRSDQQRRVVDDDRARVRAHDSDHCAQDDNREHEDDSHEYNKTTKMKPHCGDVEFLIPFFVMFLFISLWLVFFVVSRVNKHFCFLMCRMLINSFLKNKNLNFSPQK